MPGFKFMRLPLLFLIGLIAIQLGAAYVFRALRNDLHENPSFAEHRSPPRPRLQVDEPADLKAYVTEQRLLLGSYGWVDRKKKTIRMPIEKAMEILSP